MRRLGSGNRPGAALIVVAAAVVVCLLGATAGADVSAVDGRGKRITLPAAPGRIVSLSPGTTEMLFAIGLKGRIVADTSYCDYPPEAKFLPHIGDSTISAEKVLAQRPDLVVASSSANRTAIQNLEKLGVKVFAVDPKTLDETYDAIRKLAAITGQGSAAEHVVATMKSGVQRARATIPRGATRPKVLWIVQMDPLIVVGSHSFMDDLITLAGGENVGAAAGVGWPSLSPARVVVLRPDVILAGSETAPLIQGRAGWAHVPAVAQRRICTLTGEEWVRPGPRLVGAVRQVISILHPTAVSGRR